MRFVVGLVSAVLGMLAGWLGLALAIIAVSGPDRDGGIAMGAVFGIGPIGAIAGFIAGIVVFRRLGLVRAAAPAPTGDGATPAPAEAGPASTPPSTLSKPYAAIVSAIAVVLAAWVWLELLR